MWFSPWRRILRGRSGDAKPSGLRAGTKFVEEDTGVEYTYDPVMRNWKKKVAPYSALVAKDGSTVWAEDASGKTIASGEAGVDDASVIQSATDFLPAGGGKLYLKGHFILTEKIELISEYKKLIIEGEGVRATRIEPPIGDYAFEFNFKGTNHGLLLKNVMISSDNENQKALHIIDGQNIKIEDCRFWNTEILIEGVDYFCEGFTLQRTQHYNCGVEFKKSGGTGSWADTTFDNVFFDHISAGHAAIKINGGGIYRSRIISTAYLTGGSFIQTSADGHFGTKNWALLKFDGEGGTAFDILGEADNIGNYILISYLPDTITLLNNPNNRKLGSVFLTQRPDVFRRYYYPTVGVNDAYGEPVTILYLANSIPEIRIRCTGTFGTDETITVKLSAEYAHNTLSFEKSFTSTGDYYLSTIDKANLLVDFEGVNPLKLTAQAKTNLSSTSVDVQIAVYKLN